MECIEDILCENGVKKLLTVPCTILNKYFYKNTIETIYLSNEIFEFCNMWDDRKPLVVVPTKYPDVDLQTLEKSGIKAAIFANQALRASVKITDYVLSKIAQQGTSINIEEEISSVQEIFELQNMSQFKENNETYIN